MAVINLAYTGTINPPGVSPQLTEEQVWQGLQRKVRRGQDFVPVITSTTVVSETHADEKNYPNIPPGTSPLEQDSYPFPQIAPVDLLRVPLDHY